MKAYINIPGDVLLDFIKAKGTNFPKDAKFSHFFLDPNRLIVNAVDYVSMVFSYDSDVEQPEGDMYRRFPLGLKND